MAATPTLHHVTIKTARMQEMIDFYRAVLGVEVVKQVPFGTWLTNDGANHRIAFIAPPKVSDDDEKLAHAGMHHTAWEFASIDDLLEAYERLRDAGLRPHAVINHGATTSFYYADPDGNSVELQHDNFEDWAQSTAYLRDAPPLDDDNVGRGCDPEGLLRARRSGLSVGELHERSLAGEWPGAYDMR